MTRPLVTIIIPCFNSESWIAETIQSVLDQTWTEREIIIVDDGSTDKSREIISEYEDQVQRLIFQENRGASAARNSGMRHAKGEYIQFLDSDDMLHPEKIERQVDALLEHSDEPSVASGAWGRFSSQKEDANFRPDKLWCDLDPIQWLCLAWRHDLMMHPAAWLVPRALIQRVGEWNESISLNDDGEFFTRVILEAKHIYFVGDSKTYYRSDIQGSLSSSSNWQSLYTSFLSVIEKLHAKEDSAETRGAAADLLQRFIYTVYPYVPELQAEAQQKISSFGGSDLKPAGGDLFQLTSSLLGWKITKQLQRLIRGA